MPSLEQIEALKVRVIAGEDKRQLTTSFLTQKCHLIVKFLYFNV
jgi:hypothetical protein